MHAVRTLVYVLLGLLLTVIVVGLLLPDKAHVERSIVIEAPPEAVFPWLNSPRAFNAWSPWAQRDPDLQYVFSGPESGVGARMGWYSEHPEVGKGSQEIIASVPHQRVAQALDFGDQGTAVAYFDLQRHAGSTQVTWGFDTEFGYDLFGRYIGLMMDGWIGADYEQGLARLKQLVESDTTPPSAATARD